MIDIDKFFDWLFMFGGIYLVLMGLAFVGTVIGIGVIINKIVKRL